MFKHILVPTDGSERSHNTIRHAVPFARDAGARITVFYARPEFHADYGVEGIPLEPITKEEFEQHAENRAHEVLGFAENLCREEGVPCTSLSSSNDSPSLGIVDAATQCGCDLIFMALHGKSEIASVLLGSGTLKVLAYSTIPVLVYRPPE